MLYKYRHHFPMSVWVLGVEDEIMFCFRDLMNNLRKVDLRFLSHHQKLAFWINIYNTCIMHVRYDFLKLYFLIRTLTSSKNLEDCA